MIILILLLLLHSFGDPILPNVGNIQFGSAQSDNQYIPNPANPLTSRSDGFSYHLNTQYGLILHEQKTYKSLWNYEHTTRIFFRIPKPTKAYELAMSKSDRERRRRPTREYSEREKWREILQIFSKMQAIKCVVVGDGAVGEFSLPCKQRMHICLVYVCP